MKTISHFCLSIAALCVQVAHVTGQAWAEKMNDGKANFYEVQTFFEQTWDNQPYKRGNGWKQYKRWEAFMEPRVYPSGHLPPAQHTWDAHFDFQRRYPRPTTWRAGNWSPLGPAAWQTTAYNPGNGRINVIERDPNNSNTLYCGAPAGGCWKSTNGGSSWTPLTDHLPVLGVSAIVVDHSNSNTVYIGTGDCDGADTYSIGVLKSTDGGSTWNTTGLSWTTSNNRTIRRMVMHPTDPNTLWMASSIGIHKTTDGGNTWTQTLSGNMRDLELKPGDPSTLYAVDEYFYISTDGGNTWSVVSSGLPAAADINRITIAVTPANPNYVYYLAGNSQDASFYGLYRSTNSGASFTQQSNSPNIFCYAMDGNDTGGQSWYDIALAVSPTDAEEVYAGGINVWKSGDGGTTWTISTHWYYPPTVGYVHADIHTLMFFGNTLYCGSDGGLFLTNDGGTSWTDISMGLEIMQFYRFGGTPQDPNLIVGGAQDNGTNLFANNQWTHIIGADGMEAAIDYSNSQTIYGSSQMGNLMRSDDGGQNFVGLLNGINDVGSWVTPYVIDPVSPNILYACFRELWKSTDRGNNWVQLSNFGHNTNLHSIAVAPSDNQVIYTATYGTLYKTTDGGATWTDISAGLPIVAITYLAVHSSDPNKLWVTMSGYSAGTRVFQTNDGGNTWINLSANLPPLPVNCIAYQAGSNDGVYVGTDVGIYYKDAGLGNWVAFMDGLPNVIVNELEIHHATNKIRAATFGRGVWQSDLYTPFSLAPQANFAAEQKPLCQGEPIRLNDLSLYAAPGWQWSFPGGNPATSTDASPLVWYPNSGTYPVTLIVSNANGADTITQHITVNFANNPFMVELQTDAYAYETYWVILDSVGNVALSHGSYSIDNHLDTTSACLANGCYTFIIYDIFGDGMCCSLGNGFFNLVDGNGTVLGTGGSFASSDTIPFCLSTATGIPNAPISAIPTLTVVPNPVQHQLTIHVALGSAAASTLTIYDALGSTVWTQTIATAQETYQLPIYWGDKPNGVYWVSVQMADGRQLSNKFVKME